MPSPPPQLSQAAEAGGTGISSELVELESTPALSTPAVVVDQSEPATGQRPVVNELDVAYEMIPEAERDTWYERADQALAAAGMPEWMRITPTVRAAAVRLWQGAAALAPG